MSKSGKTPEQKLVDVLQGANPKAKVDESSVQAEEEASDFAQGASLDQSRGFRISRDLFVLLAIALSTFAIYEAYSHQLERKAAVEQMPFDSVQEPSLVESISLPESIARFEQKRIFGDPPEGGPDPEKTTIRGWRAEVRENWSLKGTSAPSDLSADNGFEAIVFDNRAKKMHFLRLGQIVNIADQDVEVARVDAQRMELRRGDEIYVLD